MKKFGGNEEGSIAIMSAFAITAILLLCALVLEASSLYLSKLEAQRIADIANLAAANTPDPIVNGVPSTRALATASQLALINGLDSADIETTVTTGTSGKQELTTHVRRDVSLGIGQMLTSMKSVSVDGISSALVGAATGDCVRSLVGPVNIYNSAMFDGPNCRISAATYLYVCGNADVSASNVEVKYTQAQEKAYICANRSMTPSIDAFIFDTASVNPLSSDSRVKAIEKRLKAMSTWPYGSTIPSKPLNPTIARGANRSFSNTNVTLSANTRYGQLTIDNSTLTFLGSGAADPSCRNPTTISGDILLSGTNRLVFNSGCYAIAGYTLNANSSDTYFETADGAEVTIAFKQYISNGNGTLTFDDMTFSFVGDVRNANGGTMIFGNVGSKTTSVSNSYSFGAGIINSTGILRFGKGPHYLNGGSVTNGTGTLTFGDGAFYLWGGSLSNASSGTIKFGDGPFYFYGGTVTNATGRLGFGRGPFEFYGGSLALNNGSTTDFGVGDVNFYGGTAYFHGKHITFAGSGDRQHGASSLFFYGGSFSMKSEKLDARGTTFAFWGGSVSLLGIGTMNMTAPTGSAPVYGYNNILFYIHGGAFSLYQGAVTDILSGIIYVPDTNVSIYGKQTIQIPDDGCLQVIAGIFDFYQNASAKFRPCSTASSSNNRVKISR